MSAFDTFNRRFQFDGEHGSLADAHNDIITIQMHAAELFNAFTETAAADRGAEGQQIHTLAWAGMALLASVQPQMAAIGAFLAEIEKADLIDLLCEAADEEDGVAPSEPATADASPLSGLKRAVEYVRRVQGKHAATPGGLGAAIERTLNAEHGRLGRSFRRDRGLHS